MAVELFTRLVSAAEVSSSIPPAAPVLIAATPADLEKLVKLPQRRSPWHAHISGLPRSRQEEKWYRALLDVVADGIGMDPTTLHFELRYHTGQILDIVRSPLLGLHLVLKSSAQMDDQEYHTYVQLAVEVLFARYLPDVRRQDVLDEVYQRTGMHAPD
jgi:hypothetical protein